MTKDQLLKEIKDNTYPPWCWTDIQDAVDRYTSALLQQTPCTTPLEFLEQMLIDAEMQKPVNIEPYVLSKAIQKIQALKLVINLIKDSQPMA